MQSESNLSTLYRIQKNNEGIPYFITKNNVNYHLLFFRCDYFKNYPDLLNREYEFGLTKNENFQIISKNEMDSTIGRTTMDYLRQFFEQSPDYIIIYNCTDADGKKKKRIDLFKRWFKQYMNSEGYHLEDLYVPLGNEISHYAILLSRKNKDFEKFIDIIHTWLKPI